MYIQKNITIAFILISLLPEKSPVGSLMCSSTIWRHSERTIQSIPATGPWSDISGFVSSTIAKFVGFDGT